MDPVTGGVIVAAGPSAKALLTIVHEALKPTLTARQARADAAAIVTKAEASRQAKVIEAIGDAQVDALRMRALEGLLDDAVRQQLNKESIVAGAIPMLATTPPEKQMEHDWLADFFDQSKNVGHPEMQRLLSAILAGEFNEPGTFSRRTLEVVRTLSRDELEMFSHACQYTFALDTEGGTRLLTLHENTFELCKRRGVLHSFDLRYLRELGMIDHIEPEGYVVRHDDQVSYRGRVCAKHPDAKLSIARLTMVGMELAPILLRERAADDFFWLALRVTVHEPGAEQEYFEVVNQGRPFNVTGKDESGNWR